MTKTKSTALSIVQEVTLKFEAMIPQFEKVIGNPALAARFARIAISAVKQNEKLLNADLPSLMASIMTAAQVNLEVDPAMGECALVPYWDNKKGKNVVQFQPMYKGILKLVRRSGEVKRIMAHCFYENEVKNGNFKIVYGMNEIVHHEPIILGDRGELAGAYAIAIMNDGEPVIEFMKRADIEVIRDRKKDKEGKVLVNPVWRTDEAEMFKKTVLKRVCKYLPKSYSDNDKFEKAIQIDNQAADGKISNISQDGDITIDGETGEITDNAPAAKIRTVSDKAARSEQELTPAPAQEILSPTPDDDDMSSMFPVG